jgi:hypothetical protein
MWPSSHGPNAACPNRGDSTAGFLTEQGPFLVVRTMAGSWLAAAVIWSAKIYYSERAKPLFSRALEERIRTRTERISAPNAGSDLAAIYKTDRAWWPRQEGWGCQAWYTPTCMISQRTYAWSDCAPMDLKQLPTSWPLRNPWWTAWDGLMVSSRWKTSWTWCKFNSHVSTTSWISKLVLTAHVHIRQAYWGVTVISCINSVWRQAIF